MLLNGFNTKEVALLLIVNTKLNSVDDLCLGCAYINSVYRCILFQSISKFFFLDIYARRGDFLRSYTFSLYVHTGLFINDK